MHFGSYGLGPQPEVGQAGAVRDQVIILDTMDVDHETVARAHVHTYVLNTR